MDKSWMLNPKAIRVAKECIHCIKEELGIKLTLAHPQFMELLTEYTELMDNEHLATSFAELCTMADHTLPGEQQEASGSRSNIVKMVSKLTHHETKQAVGAPPVPEDTVTYCGKVYPRWCGGKEFSGVYRGQPHYS